MFSLKKHFDLNSYIALDDIQLFQDHCTQPVTCDFDDDACSYESVLIEDIVDYEFSRFVGMEIKVSCVN